MKKIMNNKLLISCLSIILLFTFITCAHVPKPGLPLPPKESMKNETYLSFFQINPPDTSGTPAKYNFSAAWSRVITISAVITVASIIPSAFFMGAWENKAVKVGNKYYWKFNTQPNEIIPRTYYVTLVGDTTNLKVTWQLFVTESSSNLINFLWYDGSSNIQNTEGWWQFYNVDAPEAQQAVLKIDWKVTDEKNSKLVFSNVNSVHPDYGDTLKYTKNDKDFYLIFYDASEETTSTIYWNTLDRTGYIKGYKYLDGEKYCWNKKLEDEECAEE